jgi:peptidoglycan hydrolase-like amidase
VRYRTDGTAAVHNLTFDTRLPHNGACMSQFGAQVLS